MIDTPRSYPTPVGRAAPISPERWAVLEPLIDAALDLPVEERDAYFDRAAEGDLSLRAQLARLVAATGVDGDPQAADGRAAGRAAQLGVSGQVPDEDDAVDTGCHS